MNSLSFIVVVVWLAVIVFCAALIVSPNFREKVKGFVQKTFKRKGKPEEKPDDKPEEK